MKRIWLFDLDDTLHDAHRSAMPQMSVAMGQFIERELGLDQAASDALRRHYFKRYGLTLLGLLRHLQPWLASFHCTVVSIDGSGNKHNCHGECPGQIIPQERGSNGFGYDPIFYIPGHKATMAELAEHEKNKISHRARALLAIYPILEKFSYSAL